MTASKLKVTASSDSEDVRIYINDLLHVRFPRDKNTTVTSYVHGHKKLYVISIKSKGIKSKIEYDCKPLWKSVLKLLDKHL